MPGFYTDGAIATDKGTIFDYDASAGEVFEAGFDRQWDTNPLALAARGVRGFVEDWNARFGNGELIDAEAARKEVSSRGLDLNIPDGGISRYELDLLQYLKQREIKQNTVMSRSRGMASSAAGFAGGLAASLTDPLNVASGFIPIVGEARYARWLAQAGEGAFARAAVRAGAGVLEGAAGAAMIEPIVYIGANQQQLYYTAMDSFLNVAFGSVLGGGLHVAGGAVYDARMSRALNSLDGGLRALAKREAATRVPEADSLNALHLAVRSLEDDATVDVSSVYDTQPLREEDIVNPISRASSSEEKVQQLEALTNESETLVRQLMAKIDEKFGTVSKDNRKLPERILEKSARPSILEKKPWFSVEHIRDSYWFKTVGDVVEKLPEILKMAKDAGFGVVKVDTKKLLEPEAWGWRIVSFDLRAPNGQLIEYYLPVPELESAKKSGGHQLFEKWRNRDERTLTQDELDALREDRNLSRQNYSAAWEAFKSRTGATDSAVRAALERLAASSADATGVNSSLNSPTVPVPSPLDQDLPFQLATNPRSHTTMRGSPGSRVLNTSDISTSAENLKRETSTFNESQRTADLSQILDEADLATIRNAENAAEISKEPTPEDIASDTEQFTKHLDSMRERDLLTPEMEAMIREADEAATKLEAEAKAYEAAAICDLEPDA